MKTLEYIATCTFIAGLLWMWDSRENPQPQNVYIQIPAIDYTSPENLSDAQRDDARRKLCEVRQECKTLAEAVYFESRGEPIEGQRAVAFTILNRVEHHAWPDSVKDVVYYRCQFSYTCDGSTKKGVRETEAWQTALLVAYRAIEGVSSDPTDGADHFIEPTQVSRMPAWTKAYERVAKIGNHVFYRRGYD